MVIAIAQLTRLLPGNEIPGTGWDIFANYLQYILSAL